MLLKKYIQRVRFSKIKIDYFDILDVGTGSSEKEIKEAFQRETKKWHPDLNNGDSFRFTQVRDAYEVLNDSKKKDLHFRFNLTNNEIEDFFDGYFDTSNFNLFWEYHGGFESNDQMFYVFQQYLEECQRQLNLKNIKYYPKKKEVRPGYDISQQIELNYREAIQGGTKVISYEVMEPCTSCKTKGYRCDNGKRKHLACDICNEQYKQEFQLKNLKVLLECVKNSKYNTCSKCQGSGLAPKVRETEVKFPKGSTNETVVFIPNKGGYLCSDGTKGDLSVYFFVKPIPSLSRDGNNLFLRKKVSPAKAYFGGKVKIDILSDTFIVDLPGIENWENNSYYRMLIPGKGIFNSEEKKSGDLEILFNIEIPIGLNDKIYKLYSIYADENSDFNRSELKNQKSEKEVYLNDLASIWGK